MACCGNLTDEGYERGICRVHELIEKDSKTRLVKFCDLCGEYICKYCQRKPLRRIQAWGRQFFQ